MQGKMRASEVDDDRGMVSDADGVWDLGREDVELLERQDFCLCGCGIDGNGGIAVLMVVLGVVCFGAVVVFYGGKRHLCVGWDFVVVVEVELVMRCVVKLVL